MQLTILETVVRNRERRRCFLQARRERKTLEQVVSEEGQRRLAQKLAVAMAPHIAGASGVPPRTAPPPAPPREDVRAEVFGTNALESPALCEELRRIGGNLARIAEELASLKGALSFLSVPAAPIPYRLVADVPAPAAREEETVAAGGRESVIEVANAYR